MKVMKNNLPGRKKTCEPFGPKFIRSPIQLIFVIYLLKRKSFENALAIAVQKANFLLLSAAIPWLPCGCQK